MSAQLDALTAQVQANTTVEASAVTLIQGLANEIATAASTGDSAQLTALATQLQASASSLSAAITANTVTGTTSTAAVKSTS
jgi:hypothetical protein